MESAMSVLICKIEYEAYFISLAFLYRNVLVLCVNYIKDVIKKSIKIYHSYRILNAWGMKSDPYLSVFRSAHFHAVSWRAPGNWSHSPPTKATLNFTHKYVTEWRSVKCWISLTYYKYSPLLMNRGMNTGITQHDTVVFTKICVMSITIHIYDERVSLMLWLLSIFSLCQLCENWICMVVFTFPVKIIEMRLPFPYLTLTLSL
jgi:hypothetical protein